MDNQQPQFAFAIGDRVVIDETGVIGSVKGIYVSRNPAQYDVRYADRNGAVFSSYFLAEDLSAA